MAIYKVVLNGSAYGQDIKNILYYRNGVDIDLSGLTVGGTVEVAQAVRTMVWTFMKPLLPTAYRLQDITAYLYNEGTFELVYQNPTTVQVGENGTGTGATNGPATCAIIKFQLEPTARFANGFKPPKRGYVAIGPLTDAEVKDDGTLNLDNANDAYWTALCFALANNVETILPIPAVFFPIRVHQDKILNVIRITSYADIRDAVCRDMTSFRRSRQPES